MVYQILKKFCLNPHTDQSNDYGNQSVILDTCDIKIDDLDGSGEKPNKTILKKMKQMLKSKKGKIKTILKKMKQMLKSKEGPKTQHKTEDDHHGVRTVDEIKAAYGHGRDEGMTGPASRLREKLLLQREKLQEVDKKTQDMKEAAENYSALADQLLKLVEDEKYKKKFF